MFNIKDNFIYLTEKDNTKVPESIRTDGKYPQKYINVLRLVCPEYSSNEVLQHSKGKVLREFPELYEELFQVRVLPTNHTSPAAAQNYKSSHRRWVESDCHTSDTIRGLGMYDVIVEAVMRLGDFRIDKQYFIINKDKYERYKKYNDGQYIIQDDDNLIADIKWD